MKVTQEEMGHPGRGPGAHAVHRRWGVRRHQRVVHCHHARHRHHGGGQAQRDANGGGRGQQRGDETLLTGDVLEKVKAAALAKLGAGATVIRAETDADGNAKYEVHATKADGTMVMVYIDESYKVVSVETCG